VHHPQSAGSSRHLTTSRGENLSFARGKLSGRESSRGSARGSGLISNYQQVKNALTFVCLAGVHAEEDRRAVLNMLDEWNTKARATANPNANIQSEEEEEEEEGTGNVDTPILIHQFLILLHNNKTLSFRGVYGINSYTGELLKLFGRGPRVLDTTLAEEVGFFKYESSTRSFKLISTKSITSTIDAVSIDLTYLKK